MASNPLVRLLWGPAVLLVTLATALVVGVFTFALGLVVGEPVLLWLGYPAAGLMTGLAAGLVAAWTTNLLAPDRSRTRLWRVLAWTEAAALVGVVLVVVVRFGGAFPSASLSSLVLPFVALVSAVASLVALRSRRARDSLRRDAIASALLLLAFPLGFYGVVGVACLLGECGA